MLFKLNSERNIIAQQFKCLKLLKEIYTYRVWCAIFIFTFVIFKIIICYIY